MTWPDGNHLSREAQDCLRQTNWSDLNLRLDLHALGVHYFSPSYLPTWIPPETYATMYRRGLTPPMALPIYNPPDTHFRIQAWLNDNYSSLTYGGVQYLGTELNMQTPEEWDKPLRVCFARASPYAVLDGAFGAHLISNFISDYTDEIFMDFAYLPDPGDMSKLIEAGLPFLFGNISKRPISDFDILVLATTYPGERVNVPLALVRSGVPLHRWERFDPNLPYKTPAVFAAGIGCFTPDTVVCMADGGRKPIGEINKGDKVRSFNEVTHRFESQQVSSTRTFITSNQLLELTMEDLDGFEHLIRCTADHRFLTQRGWIEAQNLTEEDEIVSELECVAAR